MILTNRVLEDHFLTLLDAGLSNDGRRIREFASNRSYSHAESATPASSLTAPLRPWGCTSGGVPPFWGAEEASGSTWQRPGKVHNISSKEYMNFHSTCMWACYHAVLVSFPDPSLPIRHFEGGQGEMGLETRLMPCRVRIMTAFSVHS